MGLQIDCARGRDRTNGRVRGGYGVRVGGSCGKALMNKFRQKDKIVIHHRREAEIRKLGEKWAKRLGFQEFIDKALYKLRSREKARRV